MARWLLTLCVVFLLAPSLARTEQTELSLVVQDDFDGGADRWQPTDPNAWKIVDSDRGKVYSQFRGSKYEPPFRSPYNIALLKDVTVGDFVLTAKVQTLARSYGHRDVCLFFGHQDPAHFYYVHLGEKADPNSCQVMIVDGAARRPITKKTAKGTPWNEKWHEVKLVRRLADGAIEIYFDDMTTPLLTAEDKTFGPGRVGIGSFDDTANWDDVKLSGKVEK